MCASSVDRQPAPRGAAACLTSPRTSYRYWMYERRAYTSYYIGIAPTQLVVDRSFVEQRRTPER